MTELSRLRQLAGLLTESQDSTDRLDEKKLTDQELDAKIEEHRREANAAHGKAASAHIYHSDQLRRLEKIKRERMTESVDTLEADYARFMSEGVSKDFTDGVPAERRKDCEDCGGTGEIEHEYSGASRFTDCDSCEGRGWHDHEEEELDEALLARNSDPNAVLIDIAQRMLGVDNFDIQGSDSLDFVDVSRAQLGKALHAAFEAGRTAR